MLSWERTYVDTDAGLRLPIFLMKLVVKLYESQLPGSHSNANVGNRDSSATAFSEVNLDGRIT